MPQPAKVASMQTSACHSTTAPLYHREGDFERTSGQSCIALELLNGCVRASPPSDPSPGCPRGLKIRALSGLRFQLQYCVAGELRRDPAMV